MLTTITEYIDRVMALHKATDDCELWYRGSNDGELSLAPGLSWRQKLNYEETLVIDFKARAPQYRFPGLPTSDGPRSEWEWYFLMQHYGLPTRLMDWSENPLIALYFALDRAPKKPNAVPCVWAVNPGEINKLSSFSEIVVPGRHFSSHWLSRCAGGHFRAGEKIEFEDDGHTYTNEYPVAIYPVRRDDRIIAQHGVFTIQGTGQKPLNELLPLRAPDGPATKVQKELVRIDINPAHTKDLLANLAVLGVAKHTVYPQIETLCEDIVNNHLGT